MLKFIATSMCMNAPTAFAIDIELLLRTIITRVYVLTPEQGIEIDTGTESYSIDTGC